MLKAADMQREWTTLELQVLKQFRSMGTRSVAQLLERSQASVEKKAQEMRISLKRTDDDVDLNVLPERLLIWVKETPFLRVCPMCGRRLATMQQTGLCRPCHLDRLIDLRIEQLDVLARERRLTKLRQDKKRMRICAHCGRAFFPRPSSTDETCGGCDHV